MGEVVKIRGANSTEATSEVLHIVPEREICSLPKETPL